jgi:hypothetical protein
MTTVLDDVSIGEPVAVSRWNHRRVSKQAHLPTMCMARQGQRNPVRHLGEDIRLMRQQDRWRIVGGSCEGAGQVVDTFVATAAANKG